MTEPNTKELKDLKKYCKKWSMRTIVDYIGSAGMGFMGHGDAEKYKEEKRILLNEIRKRFRTIDNGTL